MKHLLITLALTILAPIFISAQTINGIPIDSINKGGEYVLLMFTRKIFKNTVIMDVDFGQQRKAWSSTDSRFKDRDGNNVEFNSFMDGVNYFASAGYEFEQAFAVTIGNNQVYHYLMRKKIRPLETK